MILKGNDMLILTIRKPSRFDLFINYQINVRMSTSMHTSCFEPKRPFVRDTEVPGDRVACISAVLERRFCARGSIVERLRSL